jgi:hypothetical protein
LKKIKHITMRKLVGLKYAGIWLDQKIAYVLVNDHDQWNLVTVASHLDVGNVKGGAGTSTPFSAQDAVSESKMLARKKLQLRAYFDRIIDELEGVDEILVMGPAETKIRFEEALNTDPKLKYRITMVQTEDSMTENQIKAKVREFFQASDT